MTTSGLCHTTPLKEGYDTHGNSFISGLLHENSYDMAEAPMTLLSTKQPDTSDGSANKEIEIIDIILKSVRWQPGRRVMKTGNFGTVGCGLSCDPLVQSSTLGMRSHISLPWKLDQKRKNRRPRNFGNPELFQDLARRGTRWQSADRFLGKGFLELVRRRSRWRGSEQKRKNC